MTDFTDFVDLASERLGGAALEANDEFFAPKENLVKTSRPIFLEDEYTDRGKWMDGWETRRRREPGHDWCVVRLGLPGRIRGVGVDTAFFKGNFPESCSLEAAEGEEGPWLEILPRAPLRGDAENLFPIESDRRFTHVKLHIYPDGGVARLRVYGQAVPDAQRLSKGGDEVDLAALENGALVVAASDMFFGARHNLILPGPPRGMHDGWETRRRRGPGHDWAIVQLGAPGAIRRVEVDTTWFKGNAPGSCSLVVLEAGDPLSSTAEWREVLPPTPLQPDAVHHFEKEVLAAPTATHARLNIFPDGGVARLRLFGTVG